ncbi:MAG: fibrobacter succinogenes major paralogous domain-containing protein [Gemmatimonadota bacterium]|nr:MAG: fibrobacter succinogenes major paralogous domain-containing protein [Gemmatimonadota bacterium]
MCQNGICAGTPRECIDRDGNTYQTVKIGDQCWMAENLRVTHYRNGDPIHNVTDSTAWINLTGGAYCEYDNDDDNVPVYGRLYNWYAVSDSRNIAPEGWHVPSDEEWKQLEMYLGMSQSEADDTRYRGTDQGGKLKATGTIEEGTGLWYAPNVGATNESGFSAVPGGARDGDDGNFINFSYQSPLWSSTEGGSSTAWSRGLSCLSARVCRNHIIKKHGFSVRCVRD